MALYLFNAMRLTLLCSTGNPERAVLMADGADPYTVSRRHHLAALSYEAGLRGLESRLIGPGGDILRIAWGGRETMVVAVPSAGGGWSYLWGGRGTASTADPSGAAEQIATFLGR